MSSGSENLTLVCQKIDDYTLLDVWHSGNPLDNHISLFFLQYSLIAIVSQCIDFCLKPFGQSVIVSQILGGLLFGPSFLGRREILWHALFPPKGSLTLETTGAFGVMFFFFMIGVKMDLETMLKTERKAMTIGISVYVFTTLIPTVLSIVMTHKISMDKSLESSLPFIASAQSMTPFVVIAVLLNELKILNTDIGRLAMSAAMFCDILGFSLQALTFAVVENEGANMVTFVWIFLSVVGQYIAIVYVMRPIILWLFKRSASDGKPINELCIVTIFFFVLLTGFIGELIGQHYIMGPLLLGLVIPDGPPWGTALLSKVETLSHGFFYPTFLAVSGLHTNLFKVDFKSMWIVSFIVAVSVVVKIGAVMLPGYYYNVPLKECFVIGLILNARGITELVIYNLWKGDKILSEQEFSLTVMSIIVVNAIITPLIKLTYDPLKQYRPTTRNSIQHSWRDSELRIMVCIHKNENIPSIMNLIEASYASQDSTIGVIALILIELLGRSRPLLVAHQPHDTLRLSTCKSTIINNALNNYAQQNKEFASVESFTSVSNLETMNYDVYRIALERRANILIMPFHKQWEIDGSIEVTNKGIQNMNIKVLERAPCSVGILVDRSTKGGSLSLLLSKPAFHVGIFFIGGSDDAEALAYGSRMCRNENVYVTLVRFLQFGSEKSIERKRESELIDEYRHINFGNKRFNIINEVIKDGVEMSSCMRKLIDNYDLVMVGREHRNQRNLLEGYEEWSECKELGVIGDMLASQDFDTKASVLVMQQQRIRHKFCKSKVCPLPNEGEQIVRYDRFDEESKPSWTTFSRVL